ncbi:hypothetical protein FHW72_000977 [Ochrobactrum sp. RC6B]|nr:hypothetical protein [Ochrobactrum sp. RC6B]
MKLRVLRPNYVKYESQKDDIAAKNRNELLPQSLPIFKKGFVVVILSRCRRWRR